MSRAATAGGFAAIVLWSTTVAFARSLAEQLGAVSAAAAVYGVGGTLALAGLLIHRERLAEIRRLPRRYLAGCGALFVCYMLVLFLAVGSAGNREQVLEVGLLNYLWPTLTILFSLAILGKKARLLLLPGTLLALSGVFLVLTQGSRVSPRTFVQNLAANPPAYSLATCAAVIWALYSTLTRRWAGGRRTGAVALFLPATAAVLLPISLLAAEPRAWGARALTEAVYLGTATYLAYGLWDRAMRAGDVVLVAAGSYLTPLLSTMVSCVYLAVAPGPRLWAGCLILVAGSVLSWRSVSDAGPRDPRAAPA